MENLQLMKYKFPTLYTIIYPPYAAIYTIIYISDTQYYHILPYLYHDQPIHTQHLEFEVFHYIQLELIFNFNIQWKFKFNFSASDLKSFH